MKTAPAEGKISVTIKYLVDLSEKAGCRMEEADFSRGSTLKDVSGYLKENRNITLPDKKIISILNGKGWNQHPEGLNTSISDGDIILLLPLISGG